MAKKVKLIGRREIVDFPYLNLFSLEAKIDTGAYTTALHCHDIEEKLINEKRVLCFKLLDPGHPEYNEQEHRFEEYYKKTIKNSSGDPEERFIIRTVIAIAGKRIRCDVSLTNRMSMRYPVLIGRKMIKNKFVIDVGKKHTGGLLLSRAFPYLRNLFKR